MPTRPPINSYYKKESRPLLSSYYAATPAAEAPAPQQGGVKWDLMPDFAGIGDRLKPSYWGPKYVEETGKMLKGIYSGTVGPIVDTNLDMAGTALSNLKGVGAQLSTLNPMDFHPEQWEQRGAEASTQPFEIFGQDRNLMSNPSGQRDPGQMLRRGAGSVVSGAAGAFNTGTMLAGPTKVLAHQFLPNFLAGAGMEWGQKARRDEYADPAAVIGRGALQGVMAKLFSPKYKKVKTGSNTSYYLQTKPLQNAEKAGISRPVAETLDNLTPEQQAQFSKYAQMSAQKVNSSQMASVKSATDDVADDITAGLIKLDKIKTDKGIAIGSSREAQMALNTVYDTVELAGGLADDVAVKGGAIKTLKNGQQVLDMSRSSLPASDQKLVELLYNGRKGIKGLGAGALTPHEAQMLKDAVSNELNISAGGVSSQGTGIIYGSVKKLDSFIRQANPDLADLNDAFSEITKVIIPAQKKTGNAAQGWLSGVKSWNLARRALGSGDKTNEVIINTLEEVGSKYGIKELQNLMVKDRLAQIADDLYGVQFVTQPTGFAPQITQAIGKFASGHPVQAAAGTMDAVSRGIKPQPSVASAVTGLLDEAATGGAVAKMPLMGVGRVPFLPGEAIEQSVGAAPVLAGTEDRQSARSLGQLLKKATYRNSPEYKDFAKGIKDVAPNTPIEMIDTYFNQIKR